MTTPAPAPTVTMTTNNPSLTAEQVQKVLVEPLMDKSIFLNAGPAIYQTNGSPIRIPKLKGMTKAPTFIGESEKIPDDTRLETNEVKLLPNGMKSIKVISRFSNELARQSVVSLDTAIKNRLVNDVVDVLDEALLTSSVDNGTIPLGLLNYPDVQKMPGIGIVSLDDLHDAIALLMSANVDMTRVRWFMRVSIFRNLRKLKDGNDRYQLQPDPTQAGQFLLLGIPVTVTDRIPGGSETTIVLADFSTIAVARDLAPSVTLLPELYANYDEIGIRVITRYDAKPLHDEAILFLQGVTG